MTALRSLGLAAAAVACVACASKPEKRFPAAADCTGSGCLPAVIIGGGGGTDASANTDAGVASTNDAGVLAVEAVVVKGLTANLATVTREVNEIVDVSFVGNQEFEARVTGDALLELPGKSLPGWLRVEVADAPSKFKSTLRWTDGKEDPLQLLTADFGLYADVAAALAVQPLALSVKSALVLMTFRDVDGKLLPGLSLRVSSGVVAYDTGATFSDAIAETGEQGAVLWFNAPVGAGVTTVDFLVEHNGETLQESVPAEAGGLTVTALRWTGS